MQNNQLGVIHYKGWDNSYIPNILKEIYIDRIYAQYLEGKKDLTIFDLGCNLSLFSLYASQFAKEVFAFEPAKETFDLAQKNIQGNNITNVRLYQKAIHTKDEKIKFFHNTNTTMNSTMEVVDDKSQEVEEVEGVRWDTFVKEEKIEKIDFAKIDIEGLENELIGSESFENIVPILESGVVELHSWGGYNYQQTVTTLRDYGYRVETIPSEATILGFTKK